MDDSDVTTALRLGWELAEARGRSWPQGPQSRGPRPASGDPKAELPADLLPLRYQRGQGASRTETISTLLAQARRLRIPTAVGVPDPLKSKVEKVPEADWPELSMAFVRMDADIQDQLAQRDDALANAYLLGRGLSECYWGLGTPAAWPTNPWQSPKLLLGEERRRELGRMLGRLKAESVHELTPAVVDGTLEAWGEVVADPRWMAVRDLPTSLYEQARRWYQLLVLGQDPTTLVPPGAKLTSAFYFGRTLRAYLPQLLLAVLALALTTAAVSGKLGDLKTLLPSGLGALGLAGVLSRGQSLAQQLRVRLRQDGYTDLIALHVTVVPDRPGGGTLREVEKLVRKRRLTPPTAAPPSKA
jgi:hypothetical protein